MYWPINNKYKLCLRSFRKCTWIHFSWQGFFFLETDQNYQKDYESPICQHNILHGLRNIILPLFLQLTQNVRWSKYHSDPWHPSITFICIICHGGDILIYHKWKVRGHDLFVVTGLSEEHTAEKSLQASIQMYSVLYCSLGSDWLTDWLTRRGRQRKSKTNAWREISGQRNRAIQSWLVDECGEDWRKMNGLIDRSLNTANKDRWGVVHEEKCLELTAECCLRLSTISLMNRQEDTDTWRYSMWWIHI